VEQRVLHLSIHLYHLLVVVTVKVVEVEQQVEVVDQVEDLDGLQTVQDQVVLVDKVMSLRQLLRKELMVDSHLATPLLVVEVLHKLVQMLLQIVSLDQEETEEVLQ
jgi:hypothetical protein